MGEETVEQSRNLWYAIIFAVIGLLVGVPMSYFFQSDAAQHGGLGQYVAKFSEIFTDKTAAGLALVTIVICGIVGFLAGLFVAGIVSGLKGSSAPGSKMSRK